MKNFFKLLLVVCICICISACAKWFNGKNF